MKIVKKPKRFRVVAAIAAQRALLGKRNGGKSPLVFNAETKRFL